MQILYVFWMRKKMCLMRTGVKSKQMKWMGRTFRSLSWRISSPRLCRKYNNLSLSVVKPQSHGVAMISI